MKEGERVILFCRNGMGMAITANKKRGVRCGLGFGLEAVRKGRQDDDINALAIPADYSTDEGVKEMVKIFLQTEFNSSLRYANRLQKLANIEEKWLK
jgi:ribose 5-phosphate isomerase B